MAQRKIKIALASSLPNVAAQVDVFFDNVMINPNLSISNTIDNPMILEHEFTDNTSHQLKIKMDNDFVQSNNDLNTIVSYVQLSDESFNYPAYTYLVSNSNLNLRTTDNLSLITTILWGENGTFVLDFNTSNPVTYYDYYKFTQDNP